MELNFSFNFTVILKIIGFCHTTRQVISHIQDVRGFQFKNQRFAGVVYFTVSSVGSDTEVCVCVCVTPHFFINTAPHASQYCGTIVAVLWMCLWKPCVRLSSHSTPLKDTLFFRSLYIPCTVRQPAKSTFT